MNYELAKKLKDAGYYKSTIHKFYYCDGELSAEDDCKGEIILIPTLSELIEACGKKFGSLTQTSDGDWRATPYQTSTRTLNFLKSIVEGKTPEESVARLWLELNK